jgi:hypothetical protein
VAAATSPAQQLANRYAPVMVLADQAAPCTQGEAWRPTTVEIVLENKEVTLRAPGRGHPVVKRAPTAADMFDKRAGYFLNFPGNPNIPRCTYDRDGKRFARGKPSIAYAHIVTQRADPNAPGDEGRLSLQYWFFYYFNDFNDKHEADWENIKLFFPVGTVEAALQTPPESAGYAQHEGGEYADWNSDKVEKVGTHPVVYSAVGSHASYYSSSLWLGLSSTEGVGCDDTRGPGHQVPLGAVLLPSRAESRTSPFAWVNYEGRWGQKLPGANNGPTGPNMKPSWSAPFEWQEGLRGRSIHLPAGETLGQSISGAFCGTVAALSSVLNYFYNSPRWTILAVLLVLVTILALVIWLVRRSTWARAAAHPIRADRTIGQMLFASGKIYWKRRWLFLSLGLLAIVVFVAVRGFEELLQLAFSPLGDVTIRFGATALAALVVNGAVAIALDRLDRDRQVTVLRASGRMLRRALPLLGAIVLEAIVVVLIVLTVIGIPLLLGWLVEELGLAVLVVLIIIAVWWLARALLGWAFTSQEVCVDGYSALDVLRKSTSLVKGNWWRSAILLVTLYVIVIATGPIIGFVLLFTTSLDPQVIDLIGSGIYVLLLPFVAIAATLLFFDLQERRKRAADRAAEVAISAPSPGATA